MSKKNKKQFDGRRFFTEEDLEGLQMNDDGVLEVGFGNPEEEKPVVSKKKGKQSTVVKKTSELDKRVAAILKKIDVEDEGPEYEDNEEIDSEKFNNALGEIDNIISSTIDKVASTREAERLREKYTVDKNIEYLEKIAAKHDGLMDYEFAEYEVEGLEKEIKNEHDPLQKAKLRKELKKARAKFEECKQSREASVALLKLSSLKHEVRQANKNSLEDDVRELYSKYGKEGIHRLLTLGLDEDDEDEREAI